MASSALNSRIFSSFGKYVKSGQDWETLMRLRLLWNEENPWSELSGWEEKIAMKKKFKEEKVPYVKSSYECYLPWNTSDLAIAIKNAAKHKTVVAKPSHMTTGSYVFIISGAGDRISIPNPSGPGSHKMNQRIEKWRERKRKITLHDVVRGLGDAMEQHAGSGSALALRAANRGVILEEFTPHDAEVRVVTVGGKAVGGATDARWRLARATSAHVADGRRPAQGKEWRKLGDVIAEDWIVEEGHWESMVRWSEQLAAETDLLRVDFLVQKGGACLASEMCTFLWPESSFFDGLYPELAKCLTDHHQERARAQAHTVI